MRYCLKHSLNRVWLDEHARPQTTLESLAKLPSVFIKKDGLVTAGNASGISDGAAAVIVAGEDAVKKYKLKPLARIVSYHVEGMSSEDAFIRLEVEMLI